MYKNQGALLRQVVGWVFSDFVVFFPVPGRGRMAPAHRAQHTVLPLHPREHWIPGAKKFTNQRRGQDRSRRSVREADGINAAKGDGMERNER